MIYLIQQQKGSLLQSRLVNIFQFYQETNFMKPAKQERFSRIEAETIEDLYEQLQKIGKGSFAQVVKVRQKFGKRQIRAIKKIMVNPLAQELSQVPRLKALKGDHIIQFYGYLMEGNELNIVMNLCKGNLRDQIKKSEVPFPPKKVIEVLVQITSGMLVLDEKKVMHLDLKPQNILFEEQNYYKICDFGCSQLFSSISKVNIVSQGMMTVDNTAFGTPLYISPEIQTGKNQMSKSSCDIWAMGIILYQLTFRKHPFRIDGGKVSDLDAKMFMAGNFEIDYPQVDKKYPVDLIKMMLCADPTKRIGWKQIKGYLMKNYGREEAEFISVDEAASRQIRMSLVMANVVTTIQDHLSDDDSQFWRRNADSLNQLKQILISLSYLQLLKFYKLFTYKMKYKLPQVKTASLAFMHQNFKYEQIKLKQANNQSVILKQNIKSLENKLKVILTGLKEIIQKNKDQYEPLHKLKCFISETQKLDTLFCQGHMYPQSCQNFQIQQSDDD